MPGLVCPACGREMRVVKREGKSVTTEHDCEPPATRDDSALRRPGTADGALRYG